MCYKSSINIRCHLNESYRSQPAPNRNLLFGFVAASLCLLLALPAFADGSGRFEIVNADFRADDGIWVADARADLELSDEAFAALENGVALTIQYQFTVTRARTLWPDKRIVEHKRDIELQYNSLSRRYVVRDLNTGEQASYARLAAFAISRSCRKQELTRMIGTIFRCGLYSIAKDCQDPCRFWCSGGVISALKVSGFGGH
jgi:hypothetical protein